MSSLNISNFNGTNQHRTDDQIHRLYVVQPKRKPAKYIQHGKPKNRFITVNPDPDFHKEVGIFKLAGYSLPYIVSKEIITKHGLVRMEREQLFLAYDENLQLFVIHCEISTGRKNPAIESYATAIEVAKTRWVEIKYSKSLDKYICTTKTGICAQPNWGNDHFESIIKNSYRDQYVDSEKHPKFQLILEKKGCYK